MFLRKFRTWRHSSRTTKLTLRRKYQNSRRRLTNKLPFSKTDEVFINTISKHLGVKIDISDIDRSHRIGAPRTNGEARPIIVKFARYNVRSSVFRAKRKFKNSGMLLTDSLTRRRIGILNEARDRYGKTNVWTMDGEIFTKINNKNVNITKGPMDNTGK